MRPADPQSFVVTSMALTGVLIVAGNAKQGRAPSIGQGVGVFVVAIGLAAGAQYAPTIASGLAALVLLTTAFNYGQAGLFGAIGQATKTSTSSARTGSGTVPA